MFIRKRTRRHRAVMGMAGDSVMLNTTMPSGTSKVERSIPAGVRSPAVRGQYPRRRKWRTPLPATADEADRTKALFTTAVAGTSTVPTVLGLA